MAEPYTSKAGTSAANEDNKQPEGTATNIIESRRRRRRAPPPLELIQDSVSHNLAQIIVNMISVEYQSACCELLEITETHQAKAAILHILQEADAKQQAARDMREQRKRRRQQDSA